MADRKRAERCSAKLGRGAARAGDQRSGWGRAGHCQGLKQEAAGGGWGGLAGGGGGGISEARGWPGGSGQCQRSNGKEPVPAWVWEGGVQGRELSPFFFPQVSLCFATKTDASVVKLQNPRVSGSEGSRGSSFPIPFFLQVGAVMPTWGLAFPMPVRTDLGQTCLCVQACATPGRVGLRAGR